MSSENEKIADRPSADLRRRGLLAGALALVCSGAGRALGYVGAGPGAPAPVVVDVTERAIYDGDSPSVPKIAAALDRALAELAGPGGYGALFKKGDRVAIKLNCLAGRGLSTNREVVDAVIAGLKKAGIAENDIMLFERVGRDLERAGYRLNTGAGVRCFGHDQLAEGYESGPTMLGSLGSCFSTVLSRHCDKLINIGVLKDHDLAGVSIGLKSLYGLIHNPSKYHDNACSPYVAEVASHPLIRKKMVLSICDGLVGQYHGGPGYKPAYVWPARRILLARDPVALDAVGLSIIEGKRREAGRKTLAEEKRYPAWLAAAARLGLGETDLKKIRIVEV